MADCNKIQSWRNYGVGTNDQGAVLEIVNCCGNFRVKSVLEAERKERHRLKTRRRNLRRSCKKRYTVPVTETVDKSPRTKTRKKTPTESRRQHNIGRWKKLREKRRERSGAEDNSRFDQESDLHSAQESTERKPDYGMTDREPSGMQKILANHGEQIPGKMKLNGSNASNCYLVKDQVESQKNAGVVNMGNLGKDVALLVVKGRINGRVARILIDSGATRSFIGQDAVIQLGLRTTPARCLLQVADGTKHLSTARCPHVKFHLGTATTAATFTVTTILPKIDVILGMDWLTTINPIIDWASYTLYL